MKGNITTLQLDYTLLAILAILIPYAIIRTIAEPVEVLYTGYKKHASLFAILIGLVFVGVSIVMNSVAQQNWDVDCLIKFLLLYKVGNWAFRTNAAIGYHCVLSGIVLQIYCMVRFWRKTEPDIYDKK